MDYKGNYISGEPITSIDFDWEFAQKIMPTISVEEVSAKVKQWMTPENRVLVVIGPDQADAKHLSKEEAFAIMAEIDNSKLDPYVDQVVSASLVKQELKGAKVKNTKQLVDFDAVEWTLENNAKVIFRKADYEKDQVALIAKSNGGSSKIENDQLASAMMLSQFMGAFGVGEYDATALKKALTGKKVSMNVMMSDVNEIFSGSATPKDFETMMQLLYLQFETPRFDTAAYQAMKGRYQAFLTNMANNPQKIMSDSLQLIMTCHHPRTILMTPSIFDQISTAKIEQVYRDRFVDADDFTFFIVGNIEEETAKAMTEKYIGSLKSIPREETWVDRKVKMPEGKTVKEIEIQMEVPKSTVMIVFNSEMNYNAEQNILMNVFKEILNLRYIEEVREKEGGTYGVSLNVASEKYPRAEKALILTFDTEPAKAPHLKEIIYREMDKIVANGPTAEDLDKVVKNMQKNREQSKLHNDYWMKGLSNYYSYGYNSTLPENFELILEKMTIPQVQDFAKSFLTKADVVDLIFKPKEK
jgi:zinc protease